MYKKPRAIAPSIKGYLKEIFLPQFLHFPLKKRNESRGILSYQEILALQCGQNERPLAILIPRGAL